jgi:hypothetical protein
MSGMRTVMPIARIVMVFEGVDASSRGPLGER